MENILKSKGAAIAEIILVVFFLTGHNIFHFIPFSETPFIFLLGWLSLRLRKLGWSAVGYNKNQKWGKVILWGILLALFIQLVSTFITEPIIAGITNVPSDFSKFDSMIGNTEEALFYLFLVWTLAAFGEELSYRGYLLNRIADVGNGTKAAFIAAVILHSIFFGIGHFYQGVTGMVDTGITALILGSAYLISGRNLWITIFAHGFSNTIFIALMYFDLVRYLH